MMNVDECDFLTEYMFYNWYVHVHVVIETHTSPAMYFCLLKILSYASSLRAKSAMCFSNASLSDVRPYRLREKNSEMRCVVNRTDENSRLDDHLLCSFVDVRAKMENFNKRCLVEERIGFEFSWE